MSFRVKTVVSVKEIIYASAQMDGMEITARSEGSSGRFVRSLVKTAPVYQMERVNAKKDGVENFAIQETSAEETRQSCRGDKRNSIFKNVNL